MKQQPILFQLIVITVSSCLASSSGAAVLQELGGIPGAIFPISEASHVSADGSVVTGRALHPSGEELAYRWESGEMQSLGPAGFDLTARTTAMNASGTIIAGITFFNFSAYWWENGEASLFSDSTTEGSMGYVADISDNGSVAVGSNGFTQLQILRRVDGVVQNLNYLDEGDNRGSATAVSADGSVVVGNSSNSSSSLNKAFRWVDGVMAAIPRPEGSLQNTAVGVSADGSIVLGDSYSDEIPQRIYRYDVNAPEDQRLVLLPMENQELEVVFDKTEAVAISGDGSIILGRGYYFSSTRAVIWREKDGWMPVPLDTLVSTGSLGSGQIYGVTDISRDGSTVVGTGLNLSSSRMAFRILLDADEWAGYPVAPDGHSVDTTPLMGWIDITLGDWVWSYSLSKYVYLPESNVSPTSAWVWIPK
jgi:probable HAF family extracellular repeat protein